MTDFKFAGLSKDTPPETVRAYTEAFVRMHEANVRKERVGWGAWVFLTVLTALIFRCNDVAFWPSSFDHPCPEAKP